MPGVIMENGSRNAAHTNHDRDPRLNGANGAASTQDKGKGRSEPLQNVTLVSPTMPNGLNGNQMERYQNGGEGALPKDVKAQINQLPSELVHITQGLLPLSSLLSRLAQKTHNDLAKTITDLAQMPLPATAMNGNSHSMVNDDSSTENIAKKLRLLNFAQDAHTEWTKSLIITNWSRRSEDVGKLIDLNAHLETQKMNYNGTIEGLMDLKRDLTHARLPNPDFKTALSVLTTGKVPWLPELGYIQPPPLTAREILSSLENLNTLLAIRLGLNEYDSIPFHFMDYKIESGRVTFNVVGEFAVDLTIAKEDPETQFWFIDFRFLFSPALSETPLYVRDVLETRVNEILMTDGLSGCYKLLHGMVLTHKIGEFRRQAVGMATGKWIDGLKVEALNRALSIQYWLDRYGKKGPKSWIILGVHSGKRKTGRPHPKDTSRLSLRWFRDSKEVGDVEILFDTVNISSEALLNTVIAKHVNHILTSTYEKLLAKPMFASHEAVVSISTSTMVPAESELKVQLTRDRFLTVKMEPITGRFILGPSSRFVFEYEYKINDQCLDPATNLHNYIEEARQRAVMEDIQFRGLSLGWNRVGNPGIKVDDVKRVVPKDTSQMLWLQRPGWVKNWYFAVSMSVSGERWWLIETTDPPPNVPGPRNPARDTYVKITSALPIPIKKLSPNPTYGFLANLHVFAAALISHYSILKNLHERRTRYRLHISNNMPSAVKLPAIYLQLSELIASIGRGNKSSITTRSSLRDVAQLTFQGLEARTAKPVINQAGSSQNPSQQMQPQTPGSLSQNALVEQKQAPPNEDMFVITEARMIFSPPPQALRIIKDSIDRDIAFHQTSGAFALRLRSKVGDSVVPSLVERIVRIQRLVNFVQILQTQEKSVHCENISLGRITFTYGKVLSNAKGDAMDIHGARTEKHTAMVDFSAANNAMKLIFERGNPHIAILDHLTGILNGKEGLDGVAKLLPLTLSVLQGIDAIELAWASVSNGQAFVNVRAADWYIIRYDLSLPSVPGSSAPPKTQKVMFELRLKQRRGEPWWYVNRLDRREEGGDGVDAALKSVWSSAGLDWQGMRVSAVAKAEGIEELLREVDRAMRSFVNNGSQNDGNSENAAKATSGAPAPAPSRPKIQPPSQRQQHPTPNPSQSHGRGNQIKREIVEID